MRFERLQTARHLLPFLAIAFVLVALTWVGYLYQGPRSTEEAVSLATATSPERRVIGEVELKIWASRTVIRSGDSFELWLLVKNTSQLPLAELRIVDLYSPGFVPIGNCWIAGVPGCRPGVPSSVQPAGLETALPPGAVAMVFAELKSSGKPKPTSSKLKSAGNPTCNASAKLAAAGNPFDKPDPIKSCVTWKLAGRVITEPIEIQPVEVAPNVAHWVAIAYTLLKDLGLPLVLAILAYLFQQILHERSRVQSGRDAMLPTATANAAKYLLPAASAAGTLRRVLGEAEKLPPQKPKWWAKQQEAFYYFIFLLKRMRDGNTIGGGFFLKDQRSEEFAAGCWRAIYRRAIDHFGYLNLSHAQDLLEGHETISSFLDRLQSPDEELKSAQRAAAEVAERFPGWSKVPPHNADLRLLGVLVDILQFEANRLYLGWYDEVQIPDHEDLQRWQGAIGAFQAEYPEIAPDLASELAGYVETLPRAVRKRFREMSSRLPERGGAPAP